jgi:uncharacterized protein (TIGR03066 family)
MRLLLTLAVLLAACLAGSYAVAPVPKEKPKTIAEKLIGKWKLVKLPNGASPAGEVTLEFRKDGKMIVNNNGVIMEATYKVDNNAIHYQSKQLPKEKWSLTIKSLTHEDLIAGDQYGDSVRKRIVTGDRE